MPGYAALDGVEHLGPRRAEVEQSRARRGLGDDPARHGQAAEVRLVGARHAQRRVEEVDHGHRAGRLALGEARGVLERVDRGAPHGDAALAQARAEVVEPPARIVEQAADRGVDDARDLGAGVDAAEAEQRVGAHLGRLAGLGHQAFAEANHDRVVLGERPRQVPEALAHHVGGDGVGGLLDLVVALLVEPSPSPNRPKRRVPSAVVAAVSAKQRAMPRGVNAWRRDRLGLGALDLDVLEPEVEAQRAPGGCRRPTARPAVDCPWARGYASRAANGVRSPRWPRLARLALTLAPVPGGAAGDCRRQAERRAPAAGVDR